MSDDATKPIGVFDSGLGGLTVLKSLVARFPNENFIYLGDTARIPYGIKSSRTIALYLQQNLHFLEALQVKAVVIACNTASTQVAKVPFSKPVYNVIEPGARKAASVTKTNCIGVIGTRTTVANKSYVTEIEKISKDLTVYQQATPLLVPLVEEGWDDDPITNLIVYRYLSPLIHKGIDTLILGCTHYPILKPAIQKVTGNNIQLVDSAESVADLLQDDFTNGRLERNTNEGSVYLRYLTTDISDVFHAQAQRIMHPIPVNGLELVDLNF